MKHRQIILLIIASSLMAGDDPVEIYKAVSIIGKVLELVNALRKLIGERKKR